MSFGSQTPLARFLFSRGEVNASGRVMASGFMPHWYQPHHRFELSTYDIDALPEQSVFEIAQEVEATRGKPCKGWAVLKVSDYDAVGLEADPDDIPPRHVTVVGWPPAKEQQKLLAQKISAAFVEAGGAFVPRP